MTWIIKYSRWIDSLVTLQAHGQSRSNPAKFRNWWILQAAGERIAKLAPAATGVRSTCDCRSRDAAGSSTPATLRFENVMCAASAIEGLCHDHHPMQALSIFAPEWRRCTIGVGKRYRLEFRCRLALFRQSLQSWRLYRT